MAASFHCPRCHLPHHNAGGVPRSRGQPHRPAPPLPGQGGTHAGCPQHLSSPAVRAGLLANISPTRTPTPSNPDNVHTLSPTRARPHGAPTPREAQPKPSSAQPQKPPQPLPRHRRGSSAGRCRCSPWSPGGTRSAAGRGARHPPASGTAPGRDGMSRPSWQAEKKNN